MRLSFAVSIGYACRHPFQETGCLGERSPKEEALRRSMLVMTSRFASAATRLGSKRLVFARFGSLERSPLGGMARRALSLARCLRRLLVSLSETCFLTETTACQYR